MTQSKASSDSKAHPILRIGRDEMNLCELPWARLGRRDKRNQLTFEYRDRKTKQIKGIWNAQGAAKEGLPTEYAERAYVALLALAQEQGFINPKLNFSVYRALKIMRLGTSKNDYLYFIGALRRLKGLVIFEERSFYDNRIGARSSTQQGFSLIDRIWLSFQEDSQVIREAEGVAAWIVWGSKLWDSFQAGYIKSLDLDLYFGLKSPLARRLYRCFDKWLYQKDYYDIDLFELASRLGMVKYRQPADYRSKFKPALEELIQCGFLANYKFHSVKGKNKRYHRVTCMKATGGNLLIIPDHGIAQLDSSNLTQVEIASTTHAESHTAQQTARLYKVYGTPPSMRDMWSQTLIDLRTKMTKDVFDAHFSQSKLINLENQMATLVVGNEFSVEWVQHRLAAIVTSTLSRNLNNGQQVQTITCMTMATALKD